VHESRPRLKVGLS